MADVHVVSQGDRWAIDGGDTFNTQQWAIDAGRQLAQRQQGELVINGQDGPISEKDSHGNAPRDIEG
jgi:hypothetical protein